MERDGAPHIENKHTIAPYPKWQRVLFVRCHGIVLFDFFTHFSLYFPHRPWYCSVHLVHCKTVTRTHFLCVYTMHIMTNRNGPNETNVKLYEKWNYMRAGRKIKPTCNQFDFVEYEHKSSNQLKIKTMTFYPFRSEWSVLNQHYCFFLLISCGLFCCSSIRNTLGKKALPIGSSDAVVVVMGSQCFWRLKSSDE